MKKSQFVIKRDTNSNALGKKHEYFLKSRSVKVERGNFILKKSPFDENETF